jgi:hypothetical protein
MAGTLVNAITTKKEDYADSLALVDARNLPFTSSVPKSRAATNPRFDYTGDQYRSAPVFGGVVDGTDATDFNDEFANRGKFSNYIQIFREAPKVSQLTQEATDMPGAANPIAAAVAKGLVELKRGMEAAFLSSQDAQVDTGAVPYLTCGLGLFISTAGPTVATVPSNQRPASGQVITTATASLDEDTDLQGILKAIFDAVGMVSENYMLLCGSTLRRRVTFMTRISTTTGSTNSANRVRTFTQSAKESTVTNTTTMFDGDFGSFSVVPSSWIGMTTGSATVDDDRGYLLDMSKISLRYNQRPTSRELPDLGGGPRRLIEAIAGLECVPKGMGKFQP